LLIQPKVYETAAEVWVQTEDEGTPSFLSGVAAVRETLIPESSGRKIETEIQLLESRSNVEKVIDQLHITKSQLVQTPFDYLREALPEWLSVGKKPSAAQIRIETVELFMKGMTVEPTRSKTADTTSDVLEAHFECADKMLAARALNALLQEYLKFGSQHNRQLGQSTYRLVDAKIQVENDELRTLDDQILALTVQQSSRADVTMPVADVAPSRAVRTPNAGLPNTAVPNPGVAVDGTIASGRTGAPTGLSLLRSETIEMQAKLEEARQLYTDDSPNVRHLREQLDALRARLDDAVRATAELDARLERLERLRALALERFTELRTKRDQIELYLNLNPVEADARLITETPFQPEKPKIRTKMMLAVAGPVGGLLLGLLLVGLREYFDRRLQSADAVKRHLGIETLGIIPRAGA